MPKITKPTDEKNNHRIDQIFNWEDFVSDIIKGRYVLLVGSEVVLRKEFGGGDSTKDILDCVVDGYKMDKTLHPDFACNTFTELARKVGIESSEVRNRIRKYLQDADNCFSYECTTDAISEELKNLLRTKFFRVVMTTTFDSYLENLMREIWGDVRVMNIYGDGTEFDFLDHEQSPDDFEIRPTLYYICGKANDKNKTFVATENDALDVVAHWLGQNSPHNFLNNIKSKGLISLGCKFDDWLFRFLWFILRGNVNNIDSTLKDAVAVSFSSESGEKLNEYLKSKKVYTEQDARAFISRILSVKNQCIKGITTANSQLGGVFVSYAYEDMPIASSIVARLEKEGFKIWFDANKLESGDGYDKRIATAIAHCKFFVPILSPQVELDMSDGKLDKRYYSSMEWQLAKQRFSNIGGCVNDTMQIIPLAISGYDEHSKYHADYFPFKNTVTNLMKTPLSAVVEKMKSC